MSNSFTLTDNINKFLDKSSVIIGRAYAEKSSICLYHECCHLNSPIEQLFFIAFHTIAEVNGFRVVTRPSWARVEDFVIIPQFQIGAYRVDFIAYMAIPAHCKPSIVVIECDGHDFHDKDKKQRSYEKKREREIQKLGYRIFRFTGSDITESPYSCAKEIIEVVAKTMFEDEERPVQDTIEYEW